MNSGVKTLTRSYLKRHVTAEDIAHAEDTRANGGNTKAWEYARTRLFRNVGGCYVEKPRSTWGGHAVMYWERETECVYVKREKELHAYGSG